MSEGWVKSQGGSRKHGEGFEMRKPDSYHTEPTPSSTIDPVTGEFVVQKPVDPVTARKDKITTVAALTFTFFGLWGIYSHRVDTRLAPPPERPGIVYTQDSLTTAPPASANSPAATAELVRKLDGRLAALQLEAERTNQLPGHRVLARRLERLQGLLDQHFPDPEETTYVQRRLVEFDKDLSAFEHDIHQISPD